MQSRKYAVLSVLIAATLSAGLASPASMETLSSWSALPREIITHDATFVMIDGSSMKARLLLNKPGEFVVSTDTQSQMSLAHKQVAEVHSKFRDSSVSDYCLGHILLPLALLWAGPGLDSDRSPVQRVLLSVALAPLLIPAAAIGTAASPIVVPIKYFESRHTYHLKVQP